MFRNFRTVILFFKGLDKQCRPRSDCFLRSSLIRIFPFCYSDRHYVSSSPVNQDFIREWKKCSKFMNIYRTHLSLTMKTRIILLVMPALTWKTNSSRSVVVWWASNWGSYLYCRIDFPEKNPDASKLKK